MKFLLLYNYFFLFHVSITHFNLFENIYYAYSKFLIWSIDPYSSTEDGQVCAFMMVCLSNV